jgi:hypothetical protein
MFVRARKLFLSSCRLPLFQQTTRYSAQAFFCQNNSALEHQKSLMEIGSDFEKDCQPLNAERIYKTVIDLYPTCREAYQKLWNSWVSVHGLKIPEKELREFEEKYNKYIKANEQLNEQINHKPR